MTSITTQNLQQKFDEVYELDSLIQNNTENLALPIWMLGADAIKSKY